MNDAEPSLVGDAKVTLREITRLKVRPEQERYIASDADSIAEAHYYQQAWIRAIYADDTPVGFVMLHDENLRDDPEKKDSYALWRFMIDAAHQGKGYATRAMRLVIGHVKANPNATELLTSYVPGEGSPEGFYRKMGFEHTGGEINGETEVRLKLR